jgi:hypothetical protein
VVGDEHSRAHDEVQSAVAGAQDGVQVGERLARLGEGRAGGVPGLGVDAGLAGDEHESSGAHTLRVGPDLLRQSGAAHDLAFHLSPSAVSWLKGW